jgi:hypothetical protein
VDHTPAEYTAWASTTTGTRGCIITTEGTTATVGSTAAVGASATTVRPPDKEKP